MSMWVGEAPSAVEDRRANCGKNKGEQGVHDGERETRTYARGGVVDALATAVVRAELGRDVRQVRLACFVTRGRLYAVRLTRLSQVLVRVATRLVLRR